MDARIAFVNSKDRSVIIETYSFPFDIFGSGHNVSLVTNSRGLVGQKKEILLAPVPMSNSVSFTALEFNGRRVYTTVHARILIGVL